MGKEKEKWYSTGAAAKEIGGGISAYKIRQLARSKVIESRSVNQRIYIPETVISRLKNGIPPMPARTIDDRHEEDDEQMDREELQEQAHRPAISRLPDPPTSAANRAELFAQPSPQLAKDREKVIRLQNKAEANKLQRDIKEGDRLEQERLAKLATAKRVEKWRQDNLDYAMAQLPEGCEFAPMHAKVEELLNRIRPEHPQTRKWIDEILEQARRPIRRREEQARAVDETITFNLCRGAHGTDWETEARANAKEAVGRLNDASFDDMCAAAARAIAKVNLEFKHQQRIESESEVSYSQLGDAATSADVEEAQYLARCALQSLAPDASDYTLKNARQNAIAPVVEKVKRRKAQKDHEYQKSLHELRITVMLTRLQLPFDATSVERARAERDLRRALSALDMTATADDLQATKEEVLAPILATIAEREETRRKAEESQRLAEEARRTAEDKKRATEQAERATRTEAERNADAELSYIGNYLREFFPDDSALDHWTNERELKEELRPQLVQMILDGRFLNDTQIRRWVRRKAEDS